MDSNASLRRLCRLRILQIINDLRVAGAETLCTQLTLGLRARGVDASAFTLSESPPSTLDASLRRSGALLQPTGEAKKKALRSPANIREIRRAIVGFDIVHVHLFPSQLWAALAVATLPSSKRPVLLTTEHNTHNRRRKAILRPVEARIYAKFDRIVAISEATADSMIDWLPSVRRQMVTIPNGIDYDRFSEAHPAYRSAFLPISVESDSPIVLCAGRLAEQKDQATAIRALKEIPSAHLCLAGIGECQRALEELSKEIGVSRRVHFLGRRDDFPELLRAVDIYIQPSRWEGFGLAVAEAMAAGVPVVVSDVPGVREVVGDAGLVFPAGDSQKLADAIRGVLANPSLAAALSAKGREQARQFTLDQFVDQHLALYKSLVP